MQGLNITLPHQGEPGFTRFLAPFWSSLDINREERAGDITYRTSTSSSQIEQVLGRLLANVDEEFIPHLLIVITWGQVALRLDVTQVSCLRNGSLSFTKWTTNCY